MLATNKLDCLPPQADRASGSHCPLLTYHIRKCFPFTRTGKHLHTAGLDGSLGATAMERLPSATMLCVTMRPHIPRPQGVPKGISVTGARAYSNSPQKLVFSYRGEDMARGMSSLPGGYSHSHTQLQDKRAQRGFRVSESSSVGTSNKTEHVRRRHSHTPAPPVSHPPPVVIPALQLPQQVEWAANSICTPPLASVMFAVSLMLVCLD